MIAQVHLKVAAIKSPIYKRGQRKTDGGLRIYEWGRESKTRVAAWYMVAEM